MVRLKQTKSLGRTSLFFIGLIGMVVFSCFSKINEGEIVIFNSSISEDATPAVMSRILKAKEKPISQIKFQKGIYHFYPDKGLEQFVYISNHCDLMINTPFPINDFKNLIIDGQGSTFIFHGVMIPFLIDKSSNITVKNLTIDWADPFHSEGLIVGRDEEKKTFDMQISETYPYEIRNGQIHFIKPYYEHTLGQSILFDPKRKAIAFNTEAYTGISTIKKNNTQAYIESMVYKYEHEERAPEYKYIGKEDNLFIEELKPGLVRVHNHKKQMPPLGMILVMKGEQGFNRVSPAFRVSHTNGFNGFNINIHHAGGMGIIAENSSDLILDNFNITPSNGRMVSTTADATHFVGCSGKVVLKNSTFNNQLDDATNVHGTYQKIVDILSENQIGVRMMHHQQKGFVIGKANDTLGFVRLEDSFFPFKKATIKNTEYINSRYQIITLNEKLPKDLRAGDLIENLDGYPDLLVQNCNISNNRARGLLISNPKKTVIENNFFSTEMEAILVPVESGYWFESGNAANVIIRNNVFQDCQHGGKNRGVIRFVTDDDNENIAFKNIEITNNSFKQFDNLILEISNTDKLEFTGNTITNSGTFQQLHPENPVVKVSASKNIIFKNNTYTGEALPDNLLVTEESGEDIEFR
ncbi:right-handed parallel beta-helix repeat-containing protein [Flavivirga abyssicola]|uniref:right-handed parallel beta-helix repeat-containing protein n=1 Tax=Flavivirga abyssicola TaxID=3063533 RepID=UPI0026DEF452|nr:right-handed parallel beta-helix repeat-containing protein [Flavivirga sp. MEBiC07777]WVK13750.1 right-handed parallel beta-helix repeat-containing protein [Flavivirga sp. MEBiC07777]